MLTWIVACVLALCQPAPVVVDPVPVPDPVTRWVGLVGAFFPANEWGNALAIIECESEGNPDAVNREGSGALGLFQIKPYWWGFLLEPGESLFDPVVNIRVASVIVESDGGWGFWACKRVLQ